MDRLHIDPNTRDIVCEQLAELVKQACTQNEKNEKNDAFLSEEYVAFDFPRAKFLNPDLVYYCKRMLDHFGPDAILSAYVIVKRLVESHPAMFTDNSSYQIVLAAVSVQHHLLEDRRLSRSVIEFLGGVGVFHEGPKLADLEEALLKLTDWRNMVIWEEQVEVFHQMLDKAGYDIISSAHEPPPLPIPTPIMRPPRTPPRMRRSRALTVRQLDRISKAKREREREACRLRMPMPPPLSLERASPVPLDEYINFMQIDEAH